VTPSEGTPAGGRYWLHAGLFLLTFFTTTLVGSRLLDNFRANRPAFDLEADFQALGRILAQPVLLLDGLPFSITLLAILLAHELGHYLACRYYGVNASLPYFLPAPTVIGTLGAFIRIRSPIYTKHTLFDIGVAGPLAGFLFVIPALGLGMALSKVIPGIAQQGDLTFGTPPIVWLSQWLVFPGTPSADIYLHPIARAGWVGVMATALNLLPIGQSDGGHIVYAFFGEGHRLVTRLVVAALIPLGLLYWYGWLLWVVVFAFLGMRHPPTIYDETPLGPGRRVLGWLAMAVLLLSFAPAPIRAGGAL
jgi:membrane-associated protease RseP (regulator of RpoE activity)